MWNNYEVVKEFVAEGYLVPLDTAIQLAAEGYDLNALEGKYDGFDVQDFIDMKELYE